MAALQKELLCRRSKKDIVYYMNSESCSKVRPGELTSSRVFLEIGGDALLPFGIAALFLPDNSLWITLWTPPEDAR